MRDRERVAQHRAQRRDAGAAGDEDEPALVGVGWKRERPERAFDVHRRARLERQVRPGVPVGVDADQQLEAAVAPRIFRARRQSNTDALRSCPCVADEHGLAGA